MQLLWLSSFERLRGYLLLLLSFLYMAYYFFKLDIVGVVVFGTVITFCVCLPKMAVFPGAMSALMVGAGVILFVVYDGDTVYLQQAIISNLPLIALFASVPLLSYPLKIGGYIDYMTRFMNSRFHRDISLISFITMSTLLLSSFLNVGSLRVIHDLFSNKLINRNKILGRAVMQGFSMAAFWSPYFAGVAIILHLIGVPFLSFMVFGFIMVIAGMLISTVLLFFSLKKEPAVQTAAYKTAVGDYAETAISATSSISHKKGYELIFAFGGMFVLLFLLERSLHFDLLVLISLIAFLYPIIWSLLIKRGRDFRRSLHDYKNNVLPNVHNESILFISAAFFSKMVQITGFPGVLSNLFLSISRLSLFVTVFLIILIIVAASVIGIHQILPISVLATSLSPTVLGISPELFALTLILSWGIVPLVSPMSPTNLVASNLFKTKLYEIGSWNWQYVSLMILFSTFIITVLNI